MTLSGLQKDVLKLYRRALRMAYNKPPATRPKFHLLIRYNFRTNAHSISSRDVGAIEHLLRTGRRQIEMYEDKSVRDCWVSQTMQAWGHTEENKSNTRI